MPGGDTRTASYHPPYPLTIDRGEGPSSDVDGNRYVDLIGNFTSLVHGNAYPPIVEAVRRHREGDGVAGPERTAVELAELSARVGRSSRSASATPAPRPRCWPPTSPAP